MIVRKQLDITWADLSFAFWSCLISPNGERTEQLVKATWSPSCNTLVCLSVRTGFDLLLHSLALPKNSEVLVSALTIQHMIDIVKHHRLIPVPVDLRSDTMEVDLESLKQAISPQTRAILVAHLFGTRNDLRELGELAKRHNILLIEDCAQAFDGSDYRGHEYADVSMFSFGIIKTATALAGAVLTVRDPDLLQRMRSRSRSYPLQSRSSYFRRILGYSGIKIISYRLVFSVLVYLCKILGLEYHKLLSGVGRGFSQANLFLALRQKPCAPLLALLLRRIRNYSPADRALSISRGTYLRTKLEKHYISPGYAAESNSYWVFPLLVSDPKSLVAKASKKGFDFHPQGSLVLVTPPLNRANTFPVVAEQILRQLIFVPIEGGMDKGDQDRLLRLLASF